jgi:16S rRNA (cytidine1402-2'-O)-methyltransferase
MSKPETAIRCAHTAGVLYLVPAPLDFGCNSQASLLHSMPQGTLQVAAEIQHWICENAKSTRAYLKRIGEIQPLSAPLQMQNLTELPREVHKKGDHNGSFDARPLLQPALAGHPMGLISEAGMPAVADPGSSVVRAAHDLGITVRPLVGPVSLLLALAASGLNGQNFAFVGYVPSSPAERAQKLRELESLALRSGQTQLFIETPYRNVALLQTLLQSLQGSTRLATASGLTLDTAQCHSASIQQWKQKAWALDNHTPTVFAIGR